MYYKLFIGYYYVSVVDCFYFVDVIYFYLLVKV